MAIVFPISPSVNDTFTSGSITYKWDGQKWIGLGVTPSDKLIEGSNSLEINASNQLVWTGDDIIQSSANKSFKSNSTSAGDYVRMYAGGGTAQWDIYGNGELLRMGDNSSSATAKVQFDNPTFHRSTATTVGVAALTAKQEVNNGGYLIFDGKNSSDTSVFSVTHNGRLRISENLYMGTTDGIDTEPGIQMYLSGGDPSFTGCKADNNPAQYVTLAVFKGMSQSGTDFRENASIDVETDFSNTTGSSPGRIIFRTTKNGTTTLKTRAHLSSLGEWQMGNNVGTNHIFRQVHRSAGNSSETFSSTDMGMGDNNVCLIQVNIGGVQSLNHYGGALIYWVMPRGGNSFIASTITSITGPGVGTFSLAASGNNLVVTKDSDLVVTITVIGGGGSLDYS